MPQWRKLHTKATESLDIHEMPNDFTRLLWIMLPLVLDQHGRGVDNATWVRSKVMPLRGDVTDEMVANAMDWFADHEMTERYQANGRAYFWIPTWYSYQGNTGREADSVYPPPPSWIAPEWVNSDGEERLEASESKSRPTQEPVVNKSTLDADADTDTDTDADADFAPSAGADAPATPPEPPSEQKVQESRPKTAKAPPLTPGAQEFLRLFSAKRFANRAQREAVLALEAEHGMEKFVAAATWAAERGMARGKAIAAMRTALPKWGKQKEKRGTYRRGGKPVEQVPVALGLGERA